MWAAVPFVIAGPQCSWDCTIETVDWRVNDGIRCVAFDAASPHSCRVSFAVAHDLVASESRDRVDGRESFVSSERDPEGGQVLGSVW